MFNDSNWLLELPFFMAKVLRKLTGILEVPGMFAAEWLTATKLKLELGRGLQYEDLRSGIGIGIRARLFKPRRKITCGSDWKDQDFIGQTYLPELILN